MHAMEEDGGVTEQEEQTSQEEEEMFEDDEGGVTMEEGDEEDGEEEEGNVNWDDEEDEAGSMSPTDAGEIKAVMLPLEDPICYHCGVALIDLPLRLTTDSVDPPTVPPSLLPSPSGAKLSIPLHCEVCSRGIHSQCHIALGGSLPTQEESFVCFHCRTSQHGKYAMKAADRARVSVGPAHQVPRIPDMFFKANEASIARCKYVQVWSADAANVIIPDDRALQDYLNKACSSWPDRLRVDSTGGSMAPGSIRRLYVPRASSYSTPSVLNHYWCPFSPEHALTILHKSGYNCDSALAVLKNPLLRDCFTQVCFPPTQPYYNKWKPKDRRWRMIKIPFPSHRVEAPMLTTNNDNNYEDSTNGPRLRSRRYLY